MNNIRKNPTISFRPTPYERKEIEARIKTSRSGAKHHHFRQPRYYPKRCFFIPR